MVVERLVVVVNMVVEDDDDVLDMFREKGASIVLSAMRPQIQIKNFLMFHLQNIGLPFCE